MKTWLFLNHVNSNTFPLRRLLFRVFIYHYSGINTLMSIDESPHVSTKSRGITVRMEGYGSFVLSSFQVTP